MKPNHLFTSMLVVTALFVASCSTSKLAKNNTIADDVYNTTAQAKEYKEVAVPQQTTAQTDGQNSDYYGTSDPYYEQDYATRINRFYYANPWRTYYDGYYGFSPFGYNSFYSPYYGYGLGYNNLFNPYYSYSFYGAPYYSNYWGLYSYNYPYYGGGYYGGGYYGAIGGGIIRGGSRGNSPRPIRGSENGINRTNGTSYSGGSNGITDRTSSAGSRAERYNPTNNASGNTTRPSGTTSSTPTRSSAGDSRPTRSNDSPPPTRTYSPPTQSAPPPSSSSSGGSRGESGGSSSSGGGGGRPTRGGGR